MIVTATASCTFMAMVAHTSAHVVVAAAPFWVFVVVATQVAAQLVMTVATSAVA